MKLSNLMIATALSALSMGCMSERATSESDLIASNAHDSEKLKVATWNVEHLAFPIDKGCKPRTQEEIDALKEYANDLEANIIALQEVASEQAIKQIFPSEQWHVVISQRPDSQSYTCRANGHTSSQQKVAFAVKKSIKILDVTHSDQFSLDMPGLRYGLVLNVESPMGELEILNVHMKSGCFVDNYQASDKKSCQVLAQQIPHLDNWIAQRENAGKPYVIMGDFNHRIASANNKLAQILTANSRSTTIATHNLISCHPRYPEPIDHIIVGGFDAALSVESSRVHHFKNMKEDEMLSDHCAMSVSLF